MPPGLLRDLSSALADASWTDFRILAGRIAPLAWAYLLGSTLGAVILAAIAYRVSLAMVIAHRKRLASSPQPKKDQ